MAQNISVKEAAKIMGVSQQFVRIGMQIGQLPIGRAVQLSSIWTYHISPKLFYEYVGVPMKNEEENPKSLSEAQLIANETLIDEITKIVGQLTMTNLYGLLGCARGLKESQINE